MELVACQSSIYNIQLCAMLKKFHFNSVPSLSIRCKMKKKMGLPQNCLYTWWCVTFVTQMELSIIRTTLLTDPEYVIHHQVAFHMCNMHIDYYVLPEQSLWMLAENRLMPKFYLDVELMTSSAFSYNIRFCGVLSKLHFHAGWSSGFRQKVTMVSTRTACVTMPCEIHNQM